MTPLCELALKYGTDKYPWYTPFYDALLRDRRNSIARVLEIGIGTPEAMSHVPGYRPGASLRMWRDYFPNARVFGVDDKSASLVFEDRITSLLGNQAEQEERLELADYGPYDLIVDDGSHEHDDQVMTALSLVKSLAPGGIYIIEDVNGKLYLPFSHQYVECNIVGSDKIGHCIVIPR